MACATIQNGYEDLSWAFSNLGRVYADQGKLQEAEKRYLRALRGYEKVIGTQNVTRYRPAINTTWGLGSLLWSQGHLVEARGNYQRAYNPNRAIEFGFIGGDIYICANVNANTSPRRADAWRSLKDS
ncbi:hypothetical protein QQS21_005343 [Conoideocrella luteorostrata]|uniref:Tetratricopeptide repeat protein n=1 Tax=Conoideocrella luteorostrata TaxID=1105319 RepID=A0AAJ0CQR1_9HYPO|nr:hypothetical protein QQS21_005343 [Conoideocrella luteorostrata]